MTKSPPPHPEPDPRNPGDLSEIGSLLGGPPTHHAAENPPRRRPHDLTERLQDDGDEPPPPESRPAVERPAVKWVGQYEILGELGRGGMGVVYHAVQPGLNRPVALKMVLAGAHADPDDLARFLHEAEAVARLHHPNIVQVFEVGRHDGCPYFTMEYVEGDSLTRIIGGKPRPPRSCAELVEVLSRAVQYAHEQGVVHRDLKPANILFAASPGRESGDSRPEVAANQVPKIVDFGLAKQLDVLDSQTRTSDIVGTPSYMAPEQARADRGIVGPAVDVYGLGTILYEMLTGRAPFLGLTEMDTIRQVISDEPVAPSRSQPGVPRDLSTICLKCLQKQPSRRYATAFDLGEDLRRFLLGEPIRARPVGAAERVWRWCRRKPAVAALSAVLVLFFASTFAGVTMLWLLAVEAARREIILRQSAEWAETRAEEARSEAVAAGEKEQFHRRSAETQLYFSRIALADRELAAGHVAEAEALLGQCPEPLRGWEWGYLMGQCGTELASRKAHEPWATGVVFAGGRLVSVGGLPLNDMNAGQLAVWPPGDQLDDPKVVPLPTYLKGVTCSPDGKLAAAVGADDRLRLFDLPDGRPAGLALDGRHTVKAVAFSPDGKLLAVAGEGVALCEVATGKERLTLSEFRGEATAVAFSPDGRLLVTAGERQLRVWDTVEGRQQEVIPDVIATRLAFSPDGRSLAAAGGAVRVWDAATWRPRFVSERHNGDVYGAAFSPDGRLLASGGVDQMVRVTEVRGGREVVAFRGHESGAVRDVAFSPDGTYLVSAGQDGAIKAWDLTRNPRGLSVARTPELWGGEWVGDIALTPDGSHILRANQDVGSLEVVAADTDVGVRSAFLDLRRDFSILRETCSFSADGRFLAAPSGRDGQVVKVWDTREGREVRALPRQPLPVLAVAMSADGRRLAVACGGRYSLGLGNASVQGHVSIWTVDSHEAFPLLIRDIKRPRSLAFSPDGRRLAGVGLGDGPKGGEERCPVHVWDAQTGDVLIKVGVAGSRELGLTFDRDGTRLAVVDWDRRGVRLLNVDPGSGSGQDLLDAPLKVPTSPTRAAFSPDGRRVAVVGYDGAVRLFDAATGQEVLTLRGIGENRPDDYGFPARVLFSADGHRLVSSTWDARVNVFDAGPEPRDRWREMRGRVPAWRLQQARAALAEQDRFAFDAHRKHLEAMPATEVSVLAARGRLWASLGEWDRADGDLGRAWKLSPGDCRIGYELACVKLRLGDREKHREVCEQLFERFAGSKAAGETHLVLRAWLPIDDTPDAPIWSKSPGWARAVVDANPKFLPHRQQLGAALYRAGRFAQAEKVLRDSLKENADAKDQAATWLLLALAQRRQGREEDGRRSFEKGKGLLERARKERSGEEFLLNTKVPDWTEWLAIERWGEEAEATFPRDR